MSGEEREVSILITYTDSGDDLMTTMIKSTPHRAQHKVHQIFQDGYFRIFQKYIPIHRVVEIVIAGVLND